MTRWHKEDWPGALFGVVVAMPFAFSLLAGIVVLGDQGLRWLKWGTWTEKTIQDVIGHPIFSETTGWVGIDRILHWVDTVPLWHWLILIFPWVWLPIGIWVWWLVDSHLDAWKNPTQENLAGRLWVAGLGMVGAFIGGIFLIAWLVT